MSATDFYLVEYCFVHALTVTYWCDWHMPMWRLQNHSLFTPRSIPIWNFCSLELSVPRAFRTRDCLLLGVNFLGTFTPKCTIKNHIFF